MTKTTSSAPTAGAQAAGSEAWVNDFAAADGARWRGLVDKILKGADFEKQLVSKTADGVRIEPLYLRGALDGLADGGQPGAAPYLRGTRVTGMGGWDIRAVQAEADAAKANAAILEDLAGGATSVLLQIAHNGRAGLKADAAEIGRALDGVMLDVCPVALDAGAQGVAAAQALSQVWKARSVRSDSRLGAYNFDPIGVLAETGALGQGVDDALVDAAKLVGDVQDAPHVTALRANGHIWHSGGASEAQELAAVLATVVAYLRAAEAQSIAPAQALPKIAVTLAVDADQLMGLAKLRAGRALIWRVADACGAGAAVARMSFTAESSHRMMTKRDPWVNMLRTTMACAVGGMGGADAVTVYPFSWALGQPDAFARRIARNTSIVLIEESGLGRVSDPAGGSFAVEKLTDDLAREAWVLFQAIEAKGGIVASLVSGHIQGAIGAVKEARAKALAVGKAELTGTSAYPRLGNDGATVVPWPIVPVRPIAGGTTVAALTSQRLAEPFEALRDYADALEARTGNKPTVFLACLGPLAVHGVRATWIKNYLAAGGIDSIVSAELTQSQDAGKAFADSGATVACICSSDAVYGELGEATASVLKTAGAKRVIIAGRPKDIDVALKAAGVDSFIFSGSDMLATLGDLQAVLGE
ncbi:MAG: methylmalonyl-CoA mutase family protein [Hyphomicrobiaceae bacterium]